MKERIEYDTRELTSDKNDPMNIANSIGGGINSNKKTIGKIRILKVFSLKMINIMPDINMGKEAI